MHNNNNNNQLYYQWQNHRFDDNLTKNNFLTKLVFFFNLINLLIFVKLEFLNLLNLLFKI